VRTISPLSSRLNLTMVPWHCQQPLTASALLPGMPGDLFGEHIVEAGEDFTRLGVVTVRELLDLRLMTLAAILGRDKGGDPHAFVFPRANAVRLRGVAIQAADFDFRVTRTLPFHDKGRGVFGVATGAGLVLRRRDGLRRGGAGFAPGEEQQRDDGEQGKAGKNRLSRNRFHSSKPGVAEFMITNRI